MLHTPNFDESGHPYCGPTAIMAVTGIPLSKVRKMVRRVRADRERKLRGRVLNGGAVRDARGRKMPVRGMYNSELVEVMRRLGYKTVGEYPTGSMTLRAFMEDRGHMGPHIVNVTGHYVATGYGMMCDNASKIPMTPEEFGKVARLGKRVKRFWKFG